MSAYRNQQLASLSEEQVQKVLADARELRVRRHCVWMYKHAGALFVLMYSALFLLPTYLHFQFGILFVDWLALIIILSAGFLMRVLIQIGFNITRSEKAGKKLEGIDCSDGLVIKDGENYEI